MSKKIDNKGITVEKDEFTEWFTQIMLKADLADYTEVSGCIVFKPTAYEMWENIKDIVDEGYGQLGIRNAYFPLFIPEKFLNKEKEHVKGFSPEVAWVTQAGNTKLNERLAVRPTSETIMYPSISKWIRSYRDLPLKLNQWNNVVRWEFKNPVPFLRTREFLWSEGHTAFATQKEAEAEGKDIIELYDGVCREIMALPSLIGRKTEKEKFAGAEYTISMEFYMPNGKAIQGPDFHHDGQKFAKAYGVQFVDKNEKKQYVYQNTFAITTRMLGVMFAVHSDDKGLIMPPMVAPNTVAIIPIFDDKSKKQVLKEAEKIADALEDFGVIYDDREYYRPGFKFNEYEMKGIPLRIEIGKRDLETNSAVVVRRDNGKKESVKIGKLKKYVEETLENIQDNLLKKAEKLLKGAVVSISSFKELESAIKNKKISLTNLCSSVKCEEDLKHKTEGAKVLNIDEKKRVSGKCIICSKKAEYVARVAKSY
ncbi:MAG TPA: proline--tRNA ligase [Candidatus Pacearchaeota archaeon]|jgi:prolyl-tRNA synthetase|nr:proline--tRNA ligase [Candidatus Pacearchaeota archaeon]